MKRKILIAGGSGLVGRQSMDFLVASGYEVHLVSRRPSALPMPAMKEHVALSDDWPEIVARIKPDCSISCLGTTIRKAGSHDASRRSTMILCLPLHRPAMQLERSIL